MYKSNELAIPDAVFTMQNVLPISGARAHTVSDGASAAQRLCNVMLQLDKGNGPTLGETSTIRII